mgnify:CR=1 FL=1
MSEIFKYNKAIKAIKNAILISQYESVLSINEKQLYLNFSVGKFISENTRNGFWGTDALSAISEQLQKELPGLRGFKTSNMKNMRQFYEEWSKHLNFNKINSVSDKTPDASGEITIKNCNFNRNDNFMRSFLSISFSNHCLIIRMIKSLDERFYYINKSAENHLSYRQLEELIKSDDYNHRGKLISNFNLTIKNGAEASKALDAFSDQIFLPAVIIEELNSRDVTDIDEKVLENAIVHNIKNFILTMGKGFCFISNQFRLDAFGEDEFIDLLFFNRDLNCLVAIELKTGKFNSKYLGQLSGYLSLLNKFEKRQHENPAIGLVLCKETNKAVVDLLIQDYKNPMGVSTYKIAKKVPNKIKDTLPDIHDLRQLLESPDIVKI